MYHFFRPIGTHSHSLPLRENGTQFVYNSKMQQICHLGDGVNRVINCPKVEPNGSVMSVVVVS